MSPWTLWNTRGFAHGRFRLANARIHRARLTAAATSDAPLPDRNSTCVAKFGAENHERPDLGPTNGSASHPEATMLVCPVAWNRLPGTSPLSWFNRGRDQESSEHGTKHMVSTT